ncbi:MAG TPA: hypothetical protein VNO79_00345 [Actinomycetota bacterium]|nr:hypothetical protein [Actinomycetota bacterium]
MGRTAAVVGVPETVSWGREKEGDLMELTTREWWGIVHGMGLGALFLLAFVAAGVGSLVLGLFTALVTALAEASQTVKGWLEFWAPVGPLSGKTTLAVAAWALAWAGLHRRLRGREVSVSRAFTLAAVLVGVGVLLTFPPIFQLLAPAE